MVTRIVGLNLTISESNRSLITGYRLLNIFLNLSHLWQISEGKWKRKLVVQGVPGQQVPLACPVHVGPELDDETC